MLVMNLREIAGSEASPSAGVIDSQSVQTTESGGVCGYDAGNKVKGRKRHIVTDTCGCLIFILVYAADIQDRDGAVDVLAAIRHRFPWLRHIFADGGYAGINSVMHWPAWESGPSTSSSDPIAPRASRFCPADGSPNALSHGSDDAAVSPRTGNNPSPPPPPGRCAWTWLK